MADNGERLIKVMTEQPTDARELNDRISDDTWYILSRLLEKDPDDRYHSIKDVAIELRDLRRELPGRSPTSTPRRSSGSLAASSTRP